MGSDWYCLWPIRLDAGLEAKELGQYTLEEKIGEGGMGVVYRANHSLLRRPTAVKLLLPEKAQKNSIVRFEQEVQFVAGQRYLGRCAVVPTFQFTGGGNFATDIQFRFVVQL